MTTQSDKGFCTLMCWAVGGLAGLAVAAIMLVIGDVGWNGSIFVAALVFLVLGAFLSQTVCTGSTAKADLDAVRDGTRGPEAIARRTSALSSDNGRTAAQKAAAATSSAAQTAAAKASEAASTTAEKVDTAKDAATEKAAEAKEAATEKAAEAKQAAEKAPEKAKKAVSSDDGSKAKPDGQASDAEGAQPRLMDAPAAAGADDLKMIGGVGPKLEQTLNDMGIWHYDQIAEWGPEEIAWVDSRLKFKGRIERDDWMSQARVLAAGGETEFSAKKKK